MAACDLIQAKFDGVIREFKKKLDNDKLYDEIRNFKSAEDVYEATDKLQAEQGRTGHLRHLSKIGPFLERMQDYSKAIETFVQVKSDVLGLIWGPIRLLLQWTSVLKLSFDAIINTTAEIGDQLPHFLEFTKLFAQNVYLKDVLVLFFQDILDFYLVALQFFSTSRWKYVFEALWPRQRDRIKLVITHIDRHTLLIKDEVHREHIREAHQARLEALAHFEKSEKVNIRQEHESIRNMLSPRSYNDKLNWYHGRVCDGTNQWLTSEPVFIKWLDPKDDTSRLLWLKGIPGSGKTFLAGAVIDHVKPLGRTMFAFLSHAYASNTTALSILHSLIFQLTLDDIDLQAMLCQTSRENIGSSVAVAASVMSTLLSSLDTAYIVLDGIDEIDRIERSRLLIHIIEISKACAGVKIMISSRAESDIAAKIDPYFCSLQVNDHNTSGIQAFLFKKTHDFLESRNFLDNDKAEIEALLAPIAANAKGMFLYAKILLDCIELLHDVDTIRAELRVLPQDLDEAYARILARIKNIRSPVARQNARHILGWIGCSPTPMTIREIEQALTIEPFYELATTPVKASLNLVELCGPIVEVESGYARFVHFTVKEYIFDKAIAGYIDLSDATLELTNRCIYYLCKEQSDEWLTSHDVKEYLLVGSYRMHHYAVTYWFELVTKSIFLQGSDAPPPSLLTALETLTSVRSRYDFSDFPLLSDQGKRPELDFLDHHSKNLSQMLRHIVRFNEQISGSAIHLSQVEDWKWPAPLTDTQTSRQIYETLDGVLCRKDKHVENCSCSIIEHHYGSDLFKCGYLDCPNFRQGFSTRQAQRSHEKLHVKPWKCNDPACEYAEVGFVSQRMRDTHADLHRYAQGPQINLTSGFDRNNDIAALLMDLIQLDKPSEIEALLPHWEARNLSKVLEAVIEHGSAAVIDLLLKPHNMKGADITSLIASSIKKGNLAALHILKPLVKELHGYHYIHLVGAFIVSECPEARKECESMMFNEGSHADNDSKGHGKALLRAAFTPWVVRTGDSNERQLRLLSIWTRLSTTSYFHSSGTAYFILALCPAASVSSITLAKALLQYGIGNIESRKSDSWPTPLQNAARRDSEESAKMMEFLLYHGADPELQGRRAKLKISEEKGAKGISKWLNMSWEELVEKVKADRARGYCPPEYRLETGVA